LPNVCSIRRAPAGPGVCFAFAQPKMPRNAWSRAFAQILGKLYFLQLLENFPIILFDYGEKRICRANAAFNGAC
jgi:hypothetical protein